MAEWGFEKGRGGESLTHARARASTHKGSSNLSSLTIRDIYIYIYIYIYIICICIYIQTFVLESDRVFYRGLFKASVSVYTVCVCVRACACVRVRVRVRVRARVRVCAGPRAAPRLREQVSIV